MTASDLAPTESGSVRGFGESGICMLKYGYSAYHLFAELQLILEKLYYVLVTFGYIGENFGYSQLSRKRTPSGIEKKVSVSRAVRLQELFP